ncbi:hypothetical protein [Candidatus Palauibacter sp.]|uniref:hypothetical protein n=1 Tax=Candidatus Palauibacter sp. TaxID=3101350 RepID=UPI003B5919AC
MRSPWSDSAAVAVSGTPRGVIVSSRSFPFGWSAATGDGGPAASGRIPPGNEAYYSSDPWVGTGVFALDSGFVQVLADLASDRRHLVIYDSSGAFRRRRVIDVPFGILDTTPDRGQLLALRRTDRVGLLGRDTLWVADARRRVNLYDASTGESLADFGPPTWDAATAGGEIVRPFAALANHSIMAFRWAERDVLAEVLAFRVERGTAPEGAPLALLDLRDRSVAAQVPTGDGSLRLRNPYSHSDMIAVGPRGRRVAVIRRPTPEGSPAFFVAERHDVLRGIVDTVQVSYEPRPLDAGEIRAWAEDLGPVERVVELGVFPNRAAGVEAVLEALDAPGHHPPVENRGRGIVDEGVIIDPDGGMWFRRYDASGRSNEWIVVSGEGGAGVVSRVAVPEGARLLAVSGDRVWAEVRDAFGVPAVQVLRIQGAGG